MPEDKPLRPKRPRDVNQLGVTVARIATGEVEEQPQEERDEAAAELGRKGGKARAAKQTPEERREQARKAVNKRWEQHSNDS